MGHVFCSFLALKLEHELMKRLHDHGVETEWNRLLQDIQELRAFTITSGTKTYHNTHRNTITVCIGI